MLAALILVLVTGGAVLLALPASRPRAARGIATAAAATVLALAVLSTARALAAGSPEVYRLVERTAWAPSLGVEVFVGVDPFRSGLVLLTALLGLVAVVADRDADGRRLAAMLWLEAGLIGVFVALDLLLLVACWTATLLPAAVLVARGGGAGTGERFLVGGLVGASLMLAGALIVGRQAGTFDLTVLAAHGACAETPALGAIAFAALTAGFAIPMGVVPFHRAVLDARIEAPVGASILLSGAHAEAGAFGILAVVLPVLPAPAASASGALAVLGAASLVGAGLLAPGRTDLKHLVVTAGLAFSGIVLLGAAAIAASPASREAVVGLRLHLVGHGLIAGLAVAAIAFLESNAGHRDGERLGGLVRSAPRLGLLAGLALLGLVGLPGLVTFAGQTLALLGALATHPVAALAGIVGLALLADRVVRVASRVLLGAPREPRLIPDVGPVETVLLGILGLLGILLGVAPSLLVWAGGGS